MDGDSDGLGCVKESKLAKWGRGQNQVAGGYKHPIEVRAIDPLQIRPVPQHSAPQQSVHLSVIWNGLAGQRGLRLAA